VRRLRACASAWVAAGSTLLLAGCSTLLGFEELTAIAEDASAQDGGADQHAQPESAADSQTGEDVSAEQDATASHDASAEDAVAHPCVDTQKDTFNCGVCGHDCLGGECKGGECQPVELANGLDEPTDLLLYENTILVTEYYGGKIYSIPKLGGPMTTVQSTDFPCSLAIDDTHLFWATCTYSAGGKIERCPFPGCSFHETVAPADYAPGLLRTADRLFWTESEAGKVNMIQLDVDGAAPAPVELVPGTLTLYPRRIALGGEHVYFTSTQWQDRGIYRVKADGSPGVESVFTDGPAWGVARCGAWMVWSQQGLHDGMIWRFPIGATPDAGVAEPIASGVDDPYDVAADDHNVYWVTTGGDIDVSAGQVVSCPMSDCAQKRKMYSQVQAQPWRVAVDDKAIYWLNRGLGVDVSKNGSLWMVAK